MARAWQALVALATLLAVVALTACGGTVGTSGRAASAGAARSPSPGLTGAAGTPVPTAAPSLSGTRTATATRATSPVARPASPTVAPPATTAALTVTPAAGVGGTVFAITGAGFAPDVTLHAVGRNPELEFVLNRPVATGPDGTMRLEFNALGRPPGVYTLIIGIDMMAAMGVRGGEVLARGAFTITAGGPVSTLTLEPDRGPCATDGPAIVARGRNFPPNTSFLLYVGSEARLTTDGRRLVGADGTFAVPVRLVGCGPATPDGARFRVIVPWLQHAVDPRRELASATFIVVAAAPPLPAIPTPTPDPR